MAEDKTETVFKTDGSTTAEEYTRTHAEAIRNNNTNPELANNIISPENINKGKNSRSTQR